MGITLNKQPRPFFNATAVAESVELLINPGQVTEVRMLEATTASDRWPHTLSGYFNDADKLVAALKGIKTAKGIYIIPNPVDPALLSRAANRIKKASKGESTQDTHIVERRWLLIDTDPQRPSGISANEEEHDAALQRARAIQDYLCGLGWPDPIVADSGNGAHLLYRIDLPRDDGGLIKRCLAALAELFDDDAVTVDQTVHNPARIWKLYGTLACKGDDTPDRPHRMSCVLSRPEDLHVVPRDLLESLAAESPQNVAAPAGPATNGNGQEFDVESFIARNSLDVDDPNPWSGDQGLGKVWEFKTSPMCEHHDGEAFIIQHASGAISAGCHHNSCKWVWKDLRGNLEPPTNGMTAQDFRDIDSFDATSLPDFPTHALPGPLREWVEAVSHATQTPADLAGLLALAVCSSMIARRVEVEPRPGWREPVNLFVAVLLEPGNRKSAVFTNATKPLRELESENIENARPSVARAQSERRQDESRLKKLEKEAATKQDEANRQEALDLAAELALQPEPVLPRLLVDDATAEKLAMIMEQQEGRIASMSPEGGVFDLMAGQYSKNGTPQFGVYLMGHSGDDLITDRVSRESVRVERPALTCAYATQPQVIDGLAENTAFRGRGLLGRFLYAAPTSWIGHRKIAARPVSDAVRETYRQTIRTLATIKGDVVLQLANDASVTFQEWESEIETMLADGGQMEIMRDWGAKLAGATLRIAAVIHCTDHGAAGKISAATIESAIEIARYLIPHAEAVLGMMLAKDSRSVGDAQYVLRWIERHKHREFSKRDAQQHGKHRFRRADDIDPALEELEKRGYIRMRPQETTGPGRPASPTYEVNPAVLENEKRGKRPQYSQNTAEAPPDGNSENIEGASEEPKTSDRVQETI
ncbi:YfjI family protein [Symmachiella dynata]|uniref:YfjI family protein n=1 Tax=Symmachiella dynata TaxID=2527995 RepID=UPI0030ED0830